MRLSLLSCLLALSVSGHRTRRGDESVDKVVEGSKAAAEDNEDNENITVEDHDWNDFTRMSMMRVSLETTARSTVGPMGLQVVEEVVRLLGTDCIPNMIKFLKDTDWKAKWPFDFPRPDNLDTSNNVETPT